MVKKKSRGKSEKGNDELIQPDSGTAKCNKNGKKGRRPNDQTAATLGC